MGEAIDRAQRDADELVEGFCRLQNQGLLHSDFDAYRTAAENLVTEGWTRIRPGERIVTPMSRAEAFEIVKLALEHWETLKKTAKEKRHESAEVSSDASELTSGVKGPDPESLILAAFAGADRPLEYTEACNAAAGAPVRFFPDRPWHRWNAAFRSLEDRGLIEALPAVEGEVKRYVLHRGGAKPGCGPQARDAGLRRMTGTWPHDLLGLVGILLVTGGFVWAGLPRRRGRRR